jgi:hypothetical protein
MSEFILKSDGSRDINSDALFFDEEEFKIEGESEQGICRVIARWDEEGDLYFVKILLDNGDFILYYRGKDSDSFQGNLNGDPDYKFPENFPRCVSEDDFETMLPGLYG